MNTGVAVRRAAVILSLVAAAAANADEGMVIWKNFECGYFVVQMRSGYGIFEWLGGPFPNSGDVLDGELKSLGERLVHNKTADLPTNVAVHATVPKHAQIAEKIPAKCKSAAGDPALEAP